MRNVSLTLFNRKIGLWPIFRFVRIRPQLFYGLERRCGEWPARFLQKCVMKNAQAAGLA